MDRHQDDLVGLVAVGILGVVFFRLAQQVDVLEVIAQGDGRIDRFLAVFGEHLAHLGLFFAVLLDAVEQFLHVFEAAEAFRGVVVLEREQVAGGVADPGGQFVAVARLRHFGQRFHHRDEIPQLLDGGVFQAYGIELFVFQQRCVVERTAGSRSCGGQALDGGIADAAGRHVDHPAEGLVVLRIDGQLEVGEHVLDLGPLVEGMSAVDTVGEIPFAQRFLEGARLGVGPVEDGEAVVRGFRAVDALDDGGCDQVGLLAFGVGLDHADRLAFARLREAFLLQAPFVVRDQAVGGLDDGLRGAVILLQAEFLRLGIVLLETQDVLDAGAAEAVDALGVVAHHAEVVMRLGQAAQDEILGPVGVLVLVHEDVAETARDGLAGIGEAFEQDVHLQEDVVEIHGAGRQAFLLVERIDVGQAGAPGGLVALHRLDVGPVAVNGQQIVLGPRDGALHHRGLVVLVIQFQLLDALFDDAPGVGLVVDGEVFGIAEPVGIFPQETDEDRMKGAHLDPPRLPLADEPCHALLHFSCRLLGECQGHHLTRPAVSLQNMCDPAGQHPCLTGTGSRDDQRGAFRTLDSGFLRAVQPFEQVCLRIVHNAAKLYFF